MMSKFDKKKVLTKEECRELILPAFKHAEELRLNSKVLFDKGSYSTAYSLFVLSNEELGKAFMCTLGAFGILSVKDKNIRSHTDKLKMTLLQLMTVSFYKWDKLPFIMERHLITPNQEPVSIDDIPDEIRQDIQDLVRFLMLANSMKQEGFYVGYDLNGNLSIPEDRITKDDFPPIFLKENIFGGAEKQIIQNIEVMAPTLQLYLDPDVLNSAFPVSVDDFLKDFIRPVKKK